MPKLAKRLIRYAFLGALLGGFWLIAHADDHNTDFSMSPTGSISSVCPPLPVQSYVFAVYTGTWANRGTQLHVQGSTACAGYAGVNPVSYTTGDGQYTFGFGAGSENYYQDFIISNGNIILTPTHIIPPYQPYNGNVSTSTAVAFTYSYYFNDVQSYGLIDKAAIELGDQSAGQSPIKFGSVSINASGQSTFSYATNLIAGHLYLWRPILYSSSGSTTPVAGDWYSLNVVYPAGSSTPFLGATVGTSTLVDSTNLLSFLNVPNLLNTKFPFAYIGQVSDVVFAAINSSSTKPIGQWNYTLDFGGATTTVAFFSTSTITYFLPPSLLNPLVALLKATYYVAFAFYAFRRLQGIV